MLMYANGALVPVDQAVIPVSDHAFLYGVGLFETIRVYGGKLFLWDEHFARLSSGLSALQIQFSLSASEVADKVLDTVFANGLQDAYVRVNVTAGAEGVGLTGGPYQRPGLYIFVKPVAPISDPPVPKKLQTVSLPRQTGEGWQRFKSHNFLNNVLARQEIGPKADVEGLFLTREGWVAEGIVSNVFWGKDGTLYTPSVETGILDGVTRRFVMQLAREMGIVVREGLYALKDLEGADEVFVTNSVQEVVPVISLDERNVPQCEGPLTKTLREAYRRSVELSG